MVGLLGTRRTARLFVLDVLGARSIEVAGPLLRRYWPGLTEQADLQPDPGRPARGGRGAEAGALAVGPDMSTERRGARDPIPPRRPSEAPPSVATNVGYGRRARVAKLGGQGGWPPIRRSRRGLKVPGEREVRDI